MADPAVAQTGSFAGAVAETPFHTSRAIPGWLFFIVIYRGLSHSISFLAEFSLLVSLPLDFAHQKVMLYGFNGKNLHSVVVHYMINMQQRSISDQGDCIMGEKGSSRERSKKKIRKKAKLTILEKRKRKQEKKKTRYKG